MKFNFYLRALRDFYEIQKSSLSFPFDRKIEHRRKRGPRKDRTLADCSLSDKQIIEIFHLCVRVELINLLPINYRQLLSPQLRALD